MPDVLYHYTGLPALALILRNRTIRFTRLDRVDDPQEMRTADSRNLAKFRFVSCWTDSAEESIPMWREYAGVGSGVRIELPADPFMRYALTDDDLLMAWGRLAVGPPSGDAERPLRLPFSRLWEEGPFVQEAVLAADILHEISYTDDTSHLFPRVLSLDSGGGLFARVGAVGVAKSTAWAYQSEWRYVLTAYPFALRDAVDAQEKTLGMLRDAVLDRREPNLPESFDMRISDEAFERMRVMASPAMSPGGRVILEALVDRYNPSASIVDSGLEL